MKIKSLVLASALIGSFPASSYAASIIVFNDPGGAEILGGEARAFFDLAGTPLAGGYIGLGYFTAAPDFATMPGQEISDLFVQFANSDTFAFDAYGPFIPGVFSSGFSAPIIDGGGLNSQFIGNNVTLVIGNGLDIASSTELFVFESNVLFEADNPEFALTIGFATTTPTGTILFGGESFSGGVLPVDGFGDLATAPNSFQTAELIPEPSTALVGLLGVGLLALRRRRD